MNDPDATILRPLRGADADATVVRAASVPDRDPTVVRPAGRALALPVPAAPPLPQAPPLALQPGFRLHECRIDGVLGQGGFGITYLATDVHLNARVAIKEYLPEEIAFRTGERSVSPNASRHRDRYRQGLENFLVEARTLATFRHPAIVRVARFFEAHRTAYMVLEYEQGMARALASDSDFAGILDTPADSARPALRDKLVRPVRADPDLQSIVLLDTQGKTRVSSDAQVTGGNFSFSPHFQEAMQCRAHTTGMVVGAVAGAAGLLHAEPVRADDGRVLGAMVLRIRGSSVAAILDEVRHDSTLTPLLVDGDGVLIHHPREDLLYRSLMPLPAPRLHAIRADQRFRRDEVVSLGEAGLAGALLGATAGGTVSYDSKRSGRVEIAGYAPVPGLDWVVAVTEPRAVFEAPLQTLYSHPLWSLALVGLLFTGLGLRFARSIVRPVRALTDAADALKAGRFDAAGVREDSRDEVGQLGRTFNVMIDVLRQRERERTREGTRAQVGPSPSP